MQKIVFKKLDEVPEIAVSLGTTLVNLTGSWRNLAPVIQDKSAPCMKACPSYTLIPLYFNALLDKDLDKAGEILTTNNPFPSITGRVCPAFCQIACNRKRFDERISIRDIERYIGDYYIEKKWENLFKNKSNKTIAIVGSGPAGMSCAFYLLKFGHSVVIFEKEKKAGGILRYGIPEYRLPNYIVDKEIEVLKKMGAEFEFGKELGKDIKLEELREEFSAVFIGIGANIEKKMGIQGEEIFISGSSFLKEVSEGRRTAPGKKVAVIGGGNVAMDVIRTLLRLGAKPVLLYRRTEKEMPALKEEIKRAKEDGIEFRFLTLPVKAEKKNGGINLTNIKMMLGEPDASGRRRPIPIQGSEYDEMYDAVITAIGEESDRSCVPEEIMGKDGWPYADKNTGSTNIKGVFAGGDFIEGPSTVISAFAWGKKSAYSIIRFLKGEEVFQIEKPLKTVSYALINTAYFDKKPALHAEEMPVEHRIKHIDKEEVHGFNEEMAFKEAERCFSCGICNSCGNCYVFCPDMSILWKNEKPEVDYNYCKGCGICSVECPRGIISME